MPVRPSLRLVCAALLIASANQARARSQAPGPEVAAKIAQAAQPAPPSRPPQPPPKKAGQLVNIRTDFTITEQRGNTPVIKRSVSMIVADGEAGSIRSNSDAVGVPGGLQLNVDSRPEILSGNKIRLNISLQYDGAPSYEGEVGGGPAPMPRAVKTNIREMLALIVEDGKPMTVAQSAEPTSDRQVTVEVKATIMR